MSSPPSGAEEHKRRIAQATDRLEAFAEGMQDWVEPGWKPEDSAEAATILDLPDSDQAAIVVAALSVPSSIARKEAFHQLQFTLLKRKLNYSIEDINDIAERMIYYRGRVDRKHWLKNIVRYMESHSLPEPAKKSLEKLKADVPADYNLTGAQKTSLLRVLDEILGSDEPFSFSAKDEWAIAAKADLEAMSSAEQTAWVELLKHTQTATGSKPNAKWSKTAAKLVAALPSGEFESRLTRWLPLFDDYRPPNVQMLIRGNAFPDEIDEVVLKGLIWSTASLDSPELARSIAVVGVSAFKKVPNHGARAVKTGNAAIWALGQMPCTEAVGQLAYLKMKVKGANPQKTIDKALTAAAERMDVPREEIEEMGVPEYGLTDVGLMEQALGEFTARMQIVGTGKTELVWGKPDGKTQKSVPASVIRDCADELKEIKAAAKDIQKMLPVHRDRIENLFLQRKSWPLSVWRERYLDHLLVGTLARRVIWRFTSAGESVVGCWHEGHIVDATDQRLSLLDNSDVQVELWHPIEEPTEQVLAWRDWLINHEIQQPFKQAHREVYLLTDAERQTETYSNRFAAHILRQHQLKALAEVRGWRFQMAGAWDGGEPFTGKVIPAFELNASYRLDIADDGERRQSEILPYVLTDQVRFYAVDDSERLPLRDIPPIVFSEIMRDVDLFVGVTSVGNDPTWQDGGLDGHFGDYWQSYSFGDLTTSAKTRKDVLERLIPRLTIANRCDLDDRFLIVRGDIRTYKIHLGSGNILMLPNDQYLCIVPDSSITRKSEKTFLPFEGDRILSIILSKALLLANDTKIKDRTILSQIGQ